MSGIAQQGHMIYDHTPQFNLTHGNGDPAKLGTQCVFHSKMIVGDCHACQSMCGRCRQRTAMPKRVS